MTTEHKRLSMADLSLLSGAPDRDVAEVAWEAKTLLKERDAALAHLDALLAVEPYDENRHDDWQCAYCNQSSCDEPRHDDCTWFQAKQWREAHP